MNVILLATQKQPTEHRPSINSWQYVAQRLERVPTGSPGWQAWERALPAAPRSHAGPRVSACPWRAPQAGTGQHRAQTDSATGSSRPVKRHKEIVGTCTSHTKCLYREVFFSNHAGTAGWESRAQPQLTAGAREMGLMLQRKPAMLLLTLKEVRC